jgi:hypothetical protein
MLKRTRATGLAMRCATIIAACLLCAGSARASSGLRVEVSAKPPQVPPRTTTAFERLVRQEVDRLGIDGEHQSGSYVLSAKLVELKTQSDARLATSVCAVSATLRHEQDGAIRAVLRGRARASNTKSRADWTRMAAMEGAVRSALSRLEEALR